DFCASMAEIVSLLASVININGREKSGWFLVIYFAIADLRFLQADSVTSVKLIFFYFSFSRLSTVQSAIIQYQ
ncbi:hypothetical protein M153_40570001559, partial [Pseudoloma neurophilia]